MFQVTNFCGESGRSYHFKCVSMDKADWLTQPGVAIYAAPNGRVIEVVEHAGRAEDLGAVWRWREARRFGATHAYFRKSQDGLQRSGELVDLASGLHPVCGMNSTVNEMDHLPHAA